MTNLGIPFTAVNFGFRSSYKAKVKNAIAIKAEAIESSYWSNPRIAYPKPNIESAKNKQPISLSINFIITPLKIIMTESSKSYLKEYQKYFLYYAKWEMRISKTYF